MSDTPVQTKKRKPWFRYILLTILLLLIGGGFLLYNNFNKLLSDALLRSFNSNIISDVYELKFERLRVNIFDGDIGVKNVVFQKREKPLQDYPYINSTLKLTTKELRLDKVDLIKLLKEGKLELKEIAILKPEIYLALHGEKSVLFPRNDTMVVKKDSLKKRAIHGFKLEEFRLESAAFHGINERKENKFEINDFSLSLKDLHIDQQKGIDLVLCQSLNLSIGKTVADLKTSVLRYASFSNFSVDIDSLKFQKSIDTLIYTFKDLKTQLKGLDIQTKDSLNHFSLGALDLTYKNKSLALSKVEFKPNISDAEIQKKFKYQKVNASGSVGKAEIRNINFDSLIYYHRVYIDEIFVDSAVVRIFKDKLKPLDLNRFPEYFGQDIAKIPIPLLVKKVNAENVTIFNTERKPDSTYAKVSINRGKAQVENITNLSKEKDLILSADAYIDNKVRFKATLNFSYSKPQFAFSGSFNKFELTDLNHLIQSYTPAKIKACKVDGITFSGIAHNKDADGMMKFLYHDLEIDLELKNQQKWKNSAITFAANSILPSSNPSSADSPAKEVMFHADRDMNKGFINILLKSLLTGLKETFYMSKENKKAHNEKLNKNKKGLFNLRGK